MKKPVTLSVHADLVREFERLAADQEGMKMLSNWLRRTARKRHEKSRKRRICEHAEQQVCNSAASALEKTKGIERRQKLREFGLQIKHLQKSSNFNLAMLASMIGLRPEQLVAVAEGRRQLRIKQLLQLMEILKLPATQRIELQDLLKEIATASLRTKRVPVVAPIRNSISEGNLIPAISRESNRTLESNKMRALRVDSLQPHDFLSKALYASAGVSPGEKEITALEQHPHVIREEIEKAHDSNISEQEYTPRRFVIEPVKRKTDDRFFMTLGIAIKDRREELGLTRLEVAEKAKMKRRDVQSAECGDGKISVNMLFDIANALDVDLNKMVKGAQEMLSGDCDHFEIG